jgi:formylglycine-generating enzyme required for sulfatase activity
VAAAATSLPVPALPRNEPAAPPLQEAMNTSPPRTLPAAPAPGPPAADAGGNTFRDCPTCPVMARVPAGSFVMGYGAREREAMPAHPVSIHAFALGQYPVTAGEWKACMADGGCSSMPPMSQPEDRTPVYNLSWDDTQEYISWLSRRTGKRYRLPSEAEWEYAARAGTTTPYWWGVQPGTFMANCADCGGHQDPRRPLPVDSFGPSPFGLSDMLGGVAQWVADCWFPNYTGAPSNGTARDSRGCLKRVLRGGSFRSMHDDITATARGNYDAPVRYIVNGFRVARDLD